MIHSQKISVLEFETEILGKTYWINAETTVSGALDTVSGIDCYFGTSAIVSSVVWHPNFVEFDKIEVVEIVEGDDTHIECPKILEKAREILRIQAIAQAEECDLDF